MASAALECPCLPQIVVGEKRRAWYHFVTTLCAIVGGVFVVAGMLDGLVHGSHALLKRKLDLGVPRAPSPPPLPSPHQFHAALAPQPPHAPAPRAAASVAVVRGASTRDEQYVCSGGIIFFFPPGLLGVAVHLPLSRHPGLQRRCTSVDVMAPILGRE